MNYKYHRSKNGNVSGRARRLKGFTLVEAVVAIGLAGVGVATALPALTRANMIASSSRNATGAYTVCQNQIDAILTNGPFNPQKTNADGSTQIPPELTIGTTTLQNIPIYKEPLSTAWSYSTATARTSATGFTSADVGKCCYQQDTKEYYRLGSTAPAWVLVPPTVLGVMETAVSDVSTTYYGTTMYMFQASVTVAWQFHGRGPTWSTTRNRWEYQISMNTVRTSDI